MESFIGNAKNSDQLRVPTIGVPICHQRIIRTSLTLALDPDLGDVESTRDGIPGGLADRDGFTERMA